MNENVRDQVENPYIRDLKTLVSHKDRKGSTAEIEIGDTVRVHTRIREGDKERIQVFEGVVLRWKRGTVNSAITVRKTSHGVGVERIFPLHAPTVEKVEIKAKGVVRRARLYYLRDRKGKAARLRARNQFAEKDTKAKS